MIAAIRPFEFIVVIWLSVLSFYIHTLGTSTSRHGLEPFDHQTYNIAPGSNAVFNFHGHANISYHAQYYPEQLGSFLFIGCLSGISLAAFVFWHRLNSSPEPSAKRVNGCTCHHAGRTLAIASGRQLQPLDDTSPSEVSSTASALDATGNIHGQRGRQFRSQDFGLSPNLPRASWMVKESHTVPFGKDQMPSLTTVINSLKSEEKSDTRGWDPTLMFRSRVNKPPPLPSVRARLCSIQAPPLRPLTDTDSRLSLALKEPIFSGRPKRPKATPKGRFVPHPGPADSSVRRHRGSTPRAVETHQVGRKSSLENALFGNPHIVLEPIAWFILIVAVDYGDAQDPEHDLNFWKKMLKDPALTSESIRYIGLVGKDATPTNIKDSLAQLYREALGTDLFSNLFVYLTGEGDEDQNRMHLLEGQFVSEGDIDRWLSELCIACRHPMPITLVLDICRMNNGRQSTKMHHGVRLIYSSSPGEKAGALQFESKQDTPYSSFMLALVIASTVSSSNTSTEFVAAVEKHLNQFTELIRSKASKMGNEDPGLQQPDWSQAGDLSPFLRLAKMLSRTAVVREVYKFITQMPYFSEEATSLGSNLKYSPSLKDLTTHHLRGPSNKTPVMGS